MRRIKKAQTGIKENPFMKARQLDSLKRKVQKSRTPSLKKDVDLSAPGKGMIEQLKKKGPMPASKTNIGKRGVKIGKAKGGKQMIKRADGSYSQRGLWDNIRANRGSGKKPTAAMLKQERKIKAKGK